MKFQCRVDGIHFPNEFKDSLKSPCNFWGDMGMSNLPEPLKEKFWTWLFSMPTDEIGVNGKIGIRLDITTVPIKDEDLFVNAVPGYESWTEIEQQKFQKEYFLAAKDNINMDEWLKDYLAGKKPKKERILN